DVRSGGGALEDRVGDEGDEIDDEGGDDQRDRDRIVLRADVAGDRGNRQQSKGDDEDVDEPTALLIALGDRDQLPADEVGERQLGLRWLLLGARCLCGRAHGNGWSAHLWSARMSA